MDNNNQNQNKHNLENAGNVMGSMFNTNKFDENYNRKKGMRFFLVLIIIIVIASVVIVTAKSRSFPGVTIIYAGDDKIAVHKVKTNSLGKSRLAEEIIIDYEYTGYEFEGLTGRAAQIGYVIKDYNAEMLVADPDVLTALHENRYFIKITHFLDDYSEERLLGNEQNWVGAYVRFDYGYKIENTRYYEYMAENSYVAAVSNSISLFKDKESTYTIYDFVNKLSAGEPYKYGKRTYKEQ
ncbi:MAG: hypothetical protein R3232_03605 [Clostridia bacterium]|nr:hypothetical protein [Clostridia bacterium]